MNETKAVAHISDEIEAAYQEGRIGNEVVIEDEDALDDYISGDGEWDGEDSLTHAVIFEGTILMKADNNYPAELRADWLVFQRYENGTWGYY